MPAPTLSVYLGKEGRQLFLVADLYCLQAEANYTWLLWASGRRVLLPRTLKYLETHLPAGQFVRVHRNYTVNIAYVERVEQAGYARMTVWLRSGERIDVARRRIAAVRQCLYDSQPDRRAIRH